VSGDLSAGDVARGKVIARPLSSVGVRERIDFFLDNQRPQFVAINSERASLRGKISSRPHPK
jgi:hypothetical protein